LQRSFTGTRYWNNFTNRVGKIQMKKSENPDGEQGIYRKQHKDIDYLERLS
jgi:hypothetical protein